LFEFLAIGRRQHGLEARVTESRIEGDKKATDG